MGLKVEGREYPPTITLAVRLRCGLGDSTFNATFLVAPQGQPGIEPGLQLHCLRVLTTGLLTRSAQAGIEPASSCSGRTVLSVGSDCA